MPDDPTQPPRPLSGAELRKLAIFPLPNAVLLPHTLLPLHIFEPRYRVMVEDAREERKPIAVAMLLPGRERDELGRSRVRRVVGAGRIISHRSLPDGRSNIILKGIGRVQINREWPTVRPYREVEAAPVNEIPFDPEHVEDALAAIRSSVLTLNRLSPKLGAPLIRMVANLTAADELVDVFCSLLFPEVERRQALLEEPRVAARYERVLARLAELLAEAGPATHSA